MLYVSSLYVLIIALFTTHKDCVSRLCFQSVSCPDPHEERKRVWFPVYLKLGQHYVTKWMSRFMQYLYSHYYGYCNFDIHLVI